MNESRLEWQRLEPVRPRSTPDEREVLDRAWRDRAVAPFVEDAVAAGHPILLIVNDPHRATRTAAALASLVGAFPRLRSPGSFNALIATGTHHFERPDRARFEAASFAPLGAALKTVIWHDARARESLTAVGSTRLHHLIADSAFLLAIGSVEPHYFAGLTGPHKTLTIGCMVYEDIQRNHALALDSAAAPLQLHGNPVFDDILRVVGELRSAGKRILALAEVVVGGVTVAAASGDPTQVVQSPAPVTRGVFSRVIPEPVDLLWLRVPVPLGANLYQADKALKNNAAVVRNGGGVLLEAPCPEGVGPRAFLDVLAETTPRDSLRERVRTGAYQLADHKAIQLWKLVDPADRGVRLAVVSSQLVDADIPAGLFLVFRDAAAAIAYLLRSVVGPVVKGVIVEDAGIVCTTVDAALQAR